MGQCWILAPFGMIGIQKGHTFCGTFTGFCFVLVEFEILASIYNSINYFMLDNMLGSEDTARKDS